MAGAFEILAKLDGIDGESNIKGHEKETLVLSYEQAIDEQSSGPGGGGGGAGKAIFSGVRFRKPVDVGSIPLLLASASGAHIKDAVFTFRRIGIGVEFYKVTLNDVTVAHIAQIAGTGAQYPLSFGALNAGATSDGFLDEVTLNYSKIQWQYRPVGPGGTPGSPVNGGWDVKANKKI
jgi:type VI secretion system secreted protein Hcp